jgi:tetratricopeptide (TPR) repeat protein
VTLPKATQADRQMFFDDEPIESVLYANRRAGPSNASAFIEAQSETDQIALNLAAGKTREAVRGIVGLLTSERAVPLSACSGFLMSFADLIPLCPRPVLPEGTDDCGAALRALISRARRHGWTAAVARGETLLYRWHEGRGEYSQARGVIHAALTRTDTKSDARLFATLLNNYGYELLLERCPAEAKLYFELALNAFALVHDMREIANTRANVLSCRFALSAPDEWGHLVPDLARTHRALRSHRDWRARKTLRLLAELSAERGRTSAALRWAERAVAASDTVPTRLREDDERLLAWLQTASESSPRSNRGPRITWDPAQLELFEELLGSEVRSTSRPEKCVIFASSLDAGYTPFVDPDPPSPRKKP